jgi:hypothetical protein
LNLLHVLPFLDFYPGLQVCIQKNSSKLFLNIVNIPWLDKIRASDSKSNISWV